MEDLERLRKALSEANFTIERQKKMWFILKQQNTILREFIRDRSPAEAKTLEGFAVQIEDELARLEELSKSISPKAVKKVMKVA